MSYDDNDAFSSLLIPLELSDELKQEGIVTRFDKDTRTGSLLLSLNHKYNKKNIIFPIPSTKKIDWATLLEKIAKRLRTSGVSADHILMIEDVLQTNFEKVLWEADNSTQVNSRDKQKETCYVRKYTANSLLSLHESVVFADSGQAAFVYLDRDNDGKLKTINYIERSGRILYPADNLDSQNPLPYVFASLEELNMYLELARRETFDSLYHQVGSNLRKYVNIDEHYRVIISADIIFSYFQDKFPTVHYEIFVGDNGSGKNSALLVISRLGYRVFYVVSASAANYFTFYGDIEECQGTIAEDEANDLDRDNQKQKILKSGYTSGGTVPKTDFPNGKRSQAPYNVYSLKWLAMEELPDNRKTRGIFDRSLIFKFIAGHVDYNIKEIIKNAGDPKFKPLYDELVHIHKLLFAFRLIHYDDIVSDIQINIENRNAELTKPLLRLFSSLNDAPLAVEEIRLALSKFIAEKNEIKSNSIESNLYTVIRELVEEYGDKSDYYEFTNDQIWIKCKEVMNGTEIYRESFYSIDLGKVTHKQITKLYKSKFKAETYQTSGNDSKRGLRFKKEILDRIGLQYICADEIKILSRIDNFDKDKIASDASLASLSESAYWVFNKNSGGCIPPDPGENSKPSTDLCGMTQDDSYIQSNNSNSNSNNNNSTVQSDSDYNEPLLTSDLTIDPASTNEIKLYSKYPYTPQKSDASDAIDAPHKTIYKSQDRKSKAEQAGKPDLPCIYCDFKDPIEFDLSLHYLEKHRQNLIRLPIGKSSMDAYPSYTEYQGINLTAPSIIMIDLDFKDFRSQETLDKILFGTLDKINKVFRGAQPTVLWTGGGYHIYQPLHGFVLEEIDRFACYIDPNKKDLTSRFMQFADDFLTTQIHNFPCVELATSHPKPEIKKE